MAVSTPELSQPKRERGRPSIRTAELATAICTAIAEGNSLRSICKREGMPTTTAVFYWLNEDKDFLEQYALSRRIQAELAVEECLEIADAACPETAQVARLQVDTRKWWAGKMHPRYADKAGDTHVTTIANSTIVVNDESYLIQLQERAAAQLTEVKGALPA